jgi:FAD/FMN-containing dehydrogenase
VTSQLQDSLRARLGPGGVLAGDDVGQRYEADATRQQPLRPPFVVRPSSTEELSFVLRACHEVAQPVAVQGGLTGLCGGATPHAGEIAISLERLSGVEGIDPASMTMTVRAGTPLEKVQEAAAAAGFLFPLDLGARGSCTIGGNISTNAGGNEVIRYGMARALVLGLEAVLADGTVVSSMNRMLKNNAGFDLKQLFIGTEGTLGIITRAVLRIFPAPLSAQTAMCSAADLAHVIRLLQHLRRRLAGGLSSFEVMWPDYVDFISARIEGLRVPFAADGSLFVLIEHEGTQPDSDPAMFEAVLGDALQEGIIRDAAIARSEREAAEFWRLRDGIGDVHREIARAAHFDISVPLGSLQAMIDAVKGDLAANFGDGVTQLTFGHLGDGNLHLVALSDPADQERVFELVYTRVGEFDGSISAEHGIGTVKRRYLHLSRSASEIELMRRLKKTLDPKAILNPGRVIP